MYESTSQASPRFDPNSASGIDVGFKGALDLLRTWRNGRTPDPELTVSRWADSHRLLESHVREHLASLAEVRPEFG